jgi:hypothetical protein
MYGQVIWGANITNSRMNCSLESEKITIFFLKIRKLRFLGYFGAILAIKFRINSDFLILDFSTLK